MCAQYFLVSERGQAKIAENRLLDCAWWFPPFTSPRNISTGIRVSPLVIFGRYPALDPTCTRFTVELPYSSARESQEFRFDPFVQWRFHFYQEWTSAMNAPKNGIE